MTAPHTDRDSIVIISGRPAFASFGSMSADLDAALQEKGHQTSVVWLDPETFDGDAFLKRMNTWDAERPKAIIGWNAKVNLRPNNQSINDLLSIPLINILVDHPSDHAAGLGKLPENSLTTYLDRRHRTYLEIMHPTVKTAFLPHGGPPPVSAPVPMKDREIDLLVVGRIHATPDIADCIGSIFGLPKEPEIERRASDMLDRCIDGLQDPFQAARDVLAACPFVDSTATAHAAAEALSKPLSLATNNEYRRRFFAALGNTKVTVIGQIADGETLPDVANASFVGPKSFSEVLGMLASVRVLANITPIFANGAHERVFYGMAAGCLLASTPSDYLTERYRDGESLLYFEAGDGSLEDKLKAALSDPQKADEMVAHAREIYARSDTWSQRVETLATVFE
ncbi:MAG: glycosyltransferase family 1 protein [Rhodospirillales bacterium]|nr:glycosyltransferase family 1 protein [Rhodospirillales bacterium]